MGLLSITYPAFVPFTTILSSQVNQNFDDIVTWANGNICGGAPGPSQITALSITGGEIAPGTITVDKLAPGIIGPNPPAAGVVLRPVGEIADLGVPTVPPGWLECDGSPVSQVTYAELWNAMGNAHIYGADPGGGNFLLPDHRIRLSIGDGGGVTLGDSEGFAVGSRTLAHTHFIDPPLTGVSIGANSGVNTGVLAGLDASERNALAAGASPPIAPAAGLQLVSNASQNHSHPGSEVNIAAFNSGAMSNAAPYLAVKKIIFTNVL